MKRDPLCWLKDGLACLLAVGLPFGQVTRGTQWLSLAGCLLLVLLTLLSRQRPPRQSDRFAQLSLALLAWWGLSAALSLRPLASVEATLQWATPFFAFFLYLRAHAQPGQQLRRLLALSGLAYLALLAYTFLLTAFPGKAGIRPFFADANFFAAALSLLLPGLLALGQDRRQSRWPRWAALAAGLLVLAAVVVLRSRGAWVGLGGAALLLGFVLLRHWRWRGLYLAALLGLALLAWPKVRQYQAARPALPESVAYMLSTADLRTDFSNRERLMRWELAVRMAQDDPVLGRGPGTYAPDFKHYLQNDAEVRQISYWWGWEGGAHSVWLTALAETGLPGLLLLLAWAGLFLRGLQQALRAGPNRWYAAAAVFAVGTWAVHGIFNDLWMLAPVAALLGIWMGGLSVKNDDFG